MNATRKVKLKEINPNLTCILCKGYFIDATTIIECLHSFCKSCIVKHLEKSEYCPACDVQLHTTKPLSSIRSDQMLQEIVYKLVPGLFQNETARRRKFYKENPESIPSSQEDSGHVYNNTYITSDDIIHLSLEYCTEDKEFRESTKRYIKCPAAVSIAILKKLIYGKFDLDNGAQIDIMYGVRILPDDFLLMDIAYKYSWTHNGKPLQLSYQVKGIPKSSYLHLVKAKNSSATAVEAKMAAPAVKKRQSRTSTNAAAAAISIATNEKSTPVTTPNGKVSQRGRRKRKAADNNEPSPGNNAKKATKEKPPKVKTDSPLPQPPVSKDPISTAEAVPKSVPVPVPTSQSECKEVQLRISENGVISARSVSSGEEKIIINSVANTTSTNVTSTAPVKTTSTIARMSPSKMISHLNNNMSNTNPSISFHPIPNNISTLPSPMDIAVNRANCALQPPPPPILNDKKNNSEVTITNTNNILKNSSPSAKFNLPPGTKLTPIRKKKEKPNQEKFKDRTTLISTPSPSATKAKVSKKNSTNNQEKCANVKKAMSDLEKKLQTNPRKYTKKGTVASPSTLSSALFPKDSPLRQSSPIPTQTIESHQHLNGTLKQNSIPTPLLHSLPPGTGLSLVPTTSNSFNDSLNSPNKRFPFHNTLTTASVVNGDLKFTTSPKHLLPSQSPSKDAQNVMGSPSPKKPPKFFKSRHSTSAASSADGESPNSKSSTVKITDNNRSKMNYLHTINGISPKGTLGDNNSNSMSNSIGIQNTTNSTPTTSTAGYGNLGATPQFKFHSNLTNTLNAMNLNMNMSLANGVPITNLVPFVTSNYCSMPFPISRNSFNMNMNMSHMNVPFPFGYSGVSLPTTPTTTIPSSSSSPVNKTKPSNPHPIPITTANMNIASNMSSPDTSSAINHMKTLDLSMAKNKPQQEGINGKDLMINKMRANTPTSSTPLISQVSLIDRNHNTAEFLNIPRVANLGKNKASPKGTNSKSISNTSRKSPIKNLEALLTMSGNGGGGGSNQAMGKVPEKTPEGKPTNKSPGKKDLADIIVNLADQQKKLEMQANSNSNGSSGNTNNSSINNNSAKHLNNNTNNTNAAIPPPPPSTANSNSKTETSPNNKTKNTTNNSTLNILNGNSILTPKPNGGLSSINCNANNNTQAAISVPPSLSNNPNVSLSPCKTNISDNHHNNNNVIESASNGGGDSSTCLNLNDNSSNVVVNGGNGNINSNGPLEGLNNLIANSTGSNTTNVTQIPSSSSTSA